MSSKSRIYCARRAIVLRRVWYWKGKSISDPLLRACLVLNVSENGGSRALQICQKLLPNSMLFAFYNAKVERSLWGHQYHHNTQREPVYPRRISNCIINFDKIHILQDLIGHASPLLIKEVYFTKKLRFIQKFFEDTCLLFFMRVSLCIPACSLWYLINSLIL